MNEALDLSGLVREDPELTRQEKETTIRFAPTPPNPILPGNTYPKR